jgi:GTP-binding protein
MVTNDIEFYSFHRAERSIRRADVVLMLIDATIPISEPDKKLANYVTEQFKPVIFVVNKWDLARQLLAERRNDGAEVRDEDLMEEYRKYLDEELRHLDYAPMAFITAKEGRNVQMVIDLAQHLFKQANERVSTAKLNQAVRQILEERQPSTPSGRRARIYYATQIEVAPPTIVLKVNNPNYFNDAYTRFIINRMRDLLPYEEVPIRLVVRAREHGGVKGTSLEDLPAGEVPREAERPQRDRDKVKGKGKGKAKPPVKPMRARGAAKPGGKPPPRPQAKPRPKAQAPKGRVGRSRKR